MICYALHKNGIIRLDYSACLRALQRKFGFETIRKTHLQAARCYIVFLGGQAVILKKGDILPYKDGLYELEADLVVTYDNLILIPPRYWQDEVIRVVLENEKEI